MGVRVIFVGPMREAAGGVRSMECEATSVLSLLDLLEERFGADFRKRADRSRIVVNGTAIQFARGEATPLTGGDEVSLVMPVGGG